MTAKDKIHALEVVGPSRFLTYSKEEFITLTGYNSYRTNRFSKLDEDKAASIYANMDDLVTNITNEYISLDELVEIYECTSSFYMENLYRKTYWTQDKLEALVTAIYFSHELTGVDKIDDVILKLYSPNDDKLRYRNLDVPMIAMMVLGIMPYKYDWKIKISEYGEACEKSFQFLSNILESGSILADTVEIQRIKHNRIGQHEANILGLWYAFSCVFDRLDTTANPTRIGDEYRYYDVDGLWKGEHENTIYEFQYCNPTYNFIIYHWDIREHTYYYAFCCAWFEFDEELGSPILTVVHPETSYKLAIGEKVSSDDSSIYVFRLNRFGTNKERPTEIDVEIASFKNKIEFNEHHLVRIEGQEERRLLKRLEHFKQKNMFEDYFSAYSAETGIYAITQNNILIYDSSIPNKFYCVPKALDSRLDTVRIDDLCGVLKVGNRFPWIGFESMALYFSVESEDDMAQKGITLIPDDTPLKDL